MLGMMMSMGMDTAEDWEMEALGHILSADMCIGLEAGLLHDNALSTADDGVGRFLPKGKEDSARADFVGEAVRWPFAYSAAEVIHGLGICRRAKETFHDAFPINMNVPVGWDRQVIYAAGSKSELFGMVFPSAGVGEFDEVVYERWIKWYEDNFIFSEINSVREDDTFGRVVEEWAEENVIRMDAPGFPFVGDFA